MILVELVLDIGIAPSIPSFSRGLGFRGHAVPAQHIDRFPPFRDQLDTGQLFVRYIDFHTVDVIGPDLDYDSDLLPAVSRCPRSE
ncbi:hypothetical protein D3C76_1409700 [compost metagenome]